jgi:hypothetical protein
MAGYMNGKIEIFCGDYPPSNINLFWYKRIVIDNKDFYGLYEYNKHIDSWQPINSSLVQVQLISEDELWILNDENGNQLGGE